MRASDPGLSIAGGRTTEGVGTNEPSCIAAGDGYRGMAHATCNRREGARRGNPAKRRKAAGGVFAPGAR